MSAARIVIGLIVIGLGLAPLIVACRLQQHPLPYGCTAAQEAPNGECK